jgi:hypothetical protein
VDFLLECIGFPPSTDLAALAQRIRREGERVTLRGPSGEHLRIPFPGRLEVRLDREPDQEHDSLLPHFESDHRLRVGLERLERVPDSPCDALLHGRANPPVPDDPWRELVAEEYALATYLWDARQVPRDLARGHVLALRLAGFALDVTHVGPSGTTGTLVFDEHAPALRPLEGADAPGGCMELALPVRAIHHLENPLTKERIEQVEVDAPGRPLDLFLSRWQLEAHGLQAPRPGWILEGTFLFTGRIAGGLPRRPSRAHSVS